MFNHEILNNGQQQEVETLLFEDIQPHTKNEQELLDVLTPPKELREDITNALDKIALLALTGEDQLVMRAAADYITLDIFGREFKRLPETLIWEYNAERTSPLEIALNPDVPIDIFNFHFELVPYLKIQIDELLEKYEEYKNSN